MRIAVTGGAGFIGGHLCNRLLRDGHKVVCVDNLRTGSRQNLVTLGSNPDFEFLWHDITLPLCLEVDAIYNLACPASPVHYRKDPVQTVQANTTGMVNMLELAKHVGAPILQASTSEVYGSPCVHPQHEDYWGNVNPIGVKACYSEGKRAAEAICFAYNRQYGVPVKVARIFNTYGPGMALDDGRVIPNFIAQALRNEPLTIFGRGDQTRSFCYVDDTVEALVRMMSAEVPVPVNIGNPDEISIHRLAEYVMDALGVFLPCSYQALPSDDPSRRCPDIARARVVLGWEPRVGIETGLRRTLDYFKGLVDPKP